MCDLAIEVRVCVTAAELAVKAASISDKSGLFHFLCRDIAAAYLRAPPVATTSTAQNDLSITAGDHDSLGLQGGTPGGDRAPMGCWSCLLREPPNDADTVPSQNLPKLLSGTMHGACSSFMHGMPPSVRRHIEPRVAGGADVRALRDEGPAAAALRGLGFSVFHGGVCDSVIEAHGGYQHHDY